MAEYVSDIYVESGFVDEGFVSDVYNDAGYVLGTVEGVATLSSTVSFSAAGGYTKEATPPTLSVTATVTGSAERLRQGQASLDAFNTVVSASGIIKSSSATLSSTATLTTTANKIRNATATLDAFNSVVSASTPLKGGIATLSITGSLSALGGIQKSTATATLSSNFALSGDLTQAARTITATLFEFDRTIDISTANKKWGAGSLHLHEWLTDSAGQYIGDSANQYEPSKLEYSYQEDYRLWKSVDFWFYAGPNDAPLADDNQFAFGWYNNDQQIDSAGNTDLSWKISWSPQIINFGQPDQTIEYRFQYQQKDTVGTTQTIIFANDPAERLSLGSWNHFRLVKDGTSVSAYVNGTRTNTGTVSSNQLNDLGEEPLKIGYGQFSNSGAVPDQYLDELHITKGLLNDVTDTSITVPTGAFENTTDTVILLHFDTGFDDDSTPPTVATLSSAFNLTASSTQVKNATATLTAFASQLSVGERTQGSSATLSSQFNLTTTANQIFAGTSSLNSQATVSTFGGIIKPFSASVSSAISTQIDGDRIAGGIASLDGALAFNISAGAIVSPSVDMNAVTSLSVAANEIIQGSATLKTNMGSTPWEEMNTWNNPAQTYWDSFSVNAIKVKQFDATLSSNFNISALANATLGGASLQAAFNDLDASADRIRTGTTTVNTAASLTATAERTRAGTVLKASAGTLTASAERTRAGTLSINSLATVDVTAERTRAGIVLQASSGTLSATAEVVLFGEATLSSAYGFFARTSIEGEATLTSNATVSTSAVKTARSSATLSSEASVSALGGFIASGSADLQAFNTVVSALTIYIIDPYRVKTVGSESRTLVIEAEHRNFVVKSENRLNNIEQESRGLQIKSETRKLTVQNLTLVDEAGPLDTRT